jgi:hypothetical protein
MIGRGKSWLLWVLGIFCALIFGRSALAGEAKRVPKYGAPPPPPPPPRTDPAAGKLEESADWKKITDAWSYCGPLAAGGKSTTAERKEVDARLKAAKEAVDRLVASRLLLVAEAGLLKQEADKLRADIYRNPPTDSRVTCYEMAYFPPAQQSLTRLKKRLPLLENLASNGKVKKAVMNKVLSSVDKDLATLGDEKQVEKLQEAERKEAAEVTAKVEAAVVKIRRILTPPPVMCYKAMPVPIRKPQSAKETRERLAKIEALERDGRLLQSVAAKLREGLKA